MGLCFGDHVLFYRCKTRLDVGVCVCVCVCVTYLHAVQDLEEGVGHAAPDDHLIHLVQHVLNQLNLVLNLGSEIHTQIYITKYTEPEVN